MTKTTKVKLRATAPADRKLLTGPGYEIAAEATGALTLSTTLLVKVILDDEESERQLIMLGNPGAEWPIKQDAASKVLVASSNIRVLELQSDGEKIIVIAISPEEE